MAWGVVPIGGAKIRTVSGSSRMMTWQGDEGGAGGGAAGGDADVAEEASVGTGISEGKFRVCSFTYHD